jgi:hypothetical protein
MLWQLIPARADVLQFPPSPAPFAELVKPSVVSCEIRGVRREVCGKDGGNESTTATLTAGSRTLAGSHIRPLKLQLFSL